MSDRPSSERGHELAVKHASSVDGWRMWIAAAPNQRPEPRTVYTIDDVIKAFEAGYLRGVVESS